MASELRTSDDKYMGNDEFRVFPAVLADPWTHTKASID